MASQIELWIHTVDLVKWLEWQVYPAIFFNKKILSLLTLLITACTFTVHCKSLKYFKVRLFDRHQVILRTHSIVNDALKKKELIEWRNCVMKKTFQNVSYSILHTYHSWVMFPFTVHIKFVLMLSFWKIYNSYKITMTGKN